MNKYKIIHELLEMLAYIFGIAGLFQVNSALGWAGVFMWVSSWFAEKVRELQRDALGPAVKEIAEILKDEKERWGE